MKRSSTLANLALASLLAAGASEAAQVTSATLNVSPASWTGACPKRFEFKGAITVDGGPLTVKYRFVRSDGVVGPDQTLTFAAAGSQTVADTWDLGAVGWSNMSFWKQIEVLAPNALKSNQAKFTVSCPDTASPQKLPDITGKKGMTIGGAVGGAGGKSSPWGGMVVLTEADAFLKANGKCAFNVSYDEVNAGPADTNPAFTNRLRLDGISVVAVNSNQSLLASATKQVNTQVYLTPGKHFVEVTYDDDKVVTEWSENNNKFRVGYTLDAKCQ